MYAVVELKVDGSFNKYDVEMQARVIKQFNSRQAAARLADKLNEKHSIVDPRKEIVSFIVKAV